MPETIAQGLIPTLIPKPTKAEREDMRTYYEYYEKYKDQLRKELLTELENHPFWSPLFKSTPQEVQDERNKRTEELQRNAIFNNDWEPYVIETVNQGIMYATLGVNFRSWFELISIYRRQIMVHLMEDKEVKSIHILTGLNTFIDIAMSITGEAYLAQKKSIVEQQKIEQEQLNKELEQFMYIATHDLQEPLRNITSFVELLQKKNAAQLDKDGNMYLSYVHTSANLMRSLVKGLMEYSIIGNEKVAEKTDCNVLLQHVLDGLQSSIEDNHASVVVDELPTLRLYSREMTMLFQNLVSNAIKFTRKGIEPEIHVSAKKVKDYWEFSVKDNGLGIDQKYFDKIFVIFQRLHPKNKFDGTGIGLAHCKKIVEMHHGKIWVESEPGKGSIFNFTIHEK